MPNRPQRSARILAKLIERPAIPPHMHARVLMFALIFRLREASDDFLEDLRETMGQIQPISRTAEALDWIRHAEGGIDVPQDFVMRLIGQFARPGSELSSGIELLIRRADLYRVFGRIDEAGKELDRASAGWLKERRHRVQGHERRPAAEGVALEPGTETPWANHHALQVPARTGTDNGIG